MMKAVRRIKLNSMPFDRFVDGHFVHATGYEVFVDGDWEIEYEDMKYEDADDCILEYEEEEEEE